MKKILSLMMVMLLVALSVVPAFAAEDFKYAPKNGTYTLFDKYLVLDDDADVPDLVFEYTVTGVARKAPTAGSTFEVIGTDTAPHDTMPTMYQVTEATAATATAPAAAADQNKLTFVKNEAKTATKGANDWLDLPAGKEFVKRIMKVDFTGVAFDEPGIYRYEIEEQEIAGRTDISYDTQASTPGIMKRYLDVYVTENGNKELEVSGYVLHENNSTVNATPDYGSINDNATGWTFPGGTERDTLAAAEADAVAAVSTTPNANNKYDYKGTEYDTLEAAQNVAKAEVKVTSVDLDDKSEGYVNEIATYDLEFGKEVEGNQGSKDKYFKYTVTLENLVEGTVLQLDVATKADTTPRANSATKAEYTETVMAGANGVDQRTSAEATGQQLVVAAGETSITQTFYLQDGQYIAIKGLPVGTVYTISEDAEDYQKTDGTEVATKQVLDTIGDALDNNHQDAVTGIIGSKEEYIVDNTNGTHWKDGSTYKELIDVSGTKYVTYSDDGVDTNDEAYDSTTHGDMYKLNDQNVYTGFTNTRNGVIPTGVLMSIAGGAGLIAVAGIGLFALRRRKDEDEE